MQISFDNVGPKLTITRVLQHVSEEEIYKRWCPNFPSHSFNSPFRTDKHASFGFFIKSGKWQWKDSIGEGGDCFDYVMKAEGTNLEGALQAIASSFNIGYVSAQFVKQQGDTFNPNLEIKEKVRSLIQAERKPYTIKELRYWMQFGIHYELLEFYGIKSASKVWLHKLGWNEKIAIWHSTPEDPIFYWLSPYSNHIKCYRPLTADKKNKWLSNMDDKTDIMGYAQAQIKRCPGRPLLLVKSMKDIAFFKSFGYMAMAPNAEGYIINADFIRHIQKYCSVVLSIYDADIAGLKGMIRLKKEYGIPGLVIPKYGIERTAKDPTDLWLADKQKAYKLLNLIDEYIRFLESRVDADPFGFHYT